jgi:hypothetical protein
MPLRHLADFKRVTLKSGETRTIKIDIPAARLRRWNTENERYTIDPGAWQFTASPCLRPPGADSQHYCKVTPLFPPRPRSVVLVITTAPRTRIIHNHTHPLIPPSSSLISHSLQLKL